MDQHSVIYLTLPSMLNVLDMPLFICIECLFCFLSAEAQIFRPRLILYEIFGIGSRLAVHRCLASVATLSIILMTGLSIPR